MMALPALLAILAGGYAASIGAAAAHSAPQTTLSAASPCAMADDDRRWLDAALAAWPRVEQAELGRPTERWPDILIFDAGCSYLLTDGDRRTIVANPHRDNSVAAFGKTITLAPTAYADDANRFVMSLPSIWRSAGMQRAVGLERFITAVFLHEILHTRQSAMLAAAKARINVLAPGVTQFSDDSIQEHFAGNADYIADYSMERDLLYRALAAPDDSDARTLAAAALILLDARRTRWFTGELGYFAEIEDMFLTMEGAGQWVMYRYLRSPAGGNIAADAALAEVRGRFWSQDAGFALFALVVRLVPDWQERIFDPQQWQARALLAAAAASPSDGPTAAQH
jgi:hypothetical protein